MSDIARGAWSVNAVCAAKKNVFWFTFCQRIPPTTCDRHWLLASFMSKDYVEGSELEEVDEVEKPIRIRAPEGPTPVEIEEHKATGHVQYRS